MFTGNAQEIQTAEVGDSSESLRREFGRPLDTTEAFTSYRETKTEKTDIHNSIEVGQSQAHTLRSTAVDVKPKENFWPIRNWEGVVDSITDGFFSATMRDTSNSRDQGSETFEFSLEDVEAGDKNLVAPGSIFYFTIGYHVRPGGTRIKGAQLVFRRMPLWSERDIKRVNERTQRLMELMGVAPAVGPGT